MKTKKHVLAIGLALYGTVSFAHDQNVHRAITENATDSALALSSAYADFLGSVSSDISTSDARKYLSDGSWDEDNRDQDAGGKRSLNHFYDPLTGQGLSNIMPDDRIAPYGRDSFTWASKINSPGVDVGWPISNKGTYNTWSWQNARNYEWLGLTADSQSTRQVNLDNMFRSVGQVMHLLEDTSQPQHVRNEQHLDTWWVGGPDTPWRSPIEDYGTEPEHVLTLNYQHALLDWKGDGFTKLEDFWNRHLYNGNSSALQAAENGGAQLGLAEWCNGNFLGARHLFREYFSPGSVEYYPFPSRDSGTDYSDIKSHPADGIDYFTLKNGTIGKGIYLAKTGDGITLNHIARVNYFGAKIPNLTGTPYCTIDDPNVLKDYHDALIPKAVEYSAGLLDYFFRGTLKIVWEASTTQGKGKIQIINTSGQTLSGGKFHLFWDNSDGGGRTEIPAANLTTTYTGTLVDGASIDIEYLPPTGTISDYIVVYQGAIKPPGTSSDPVEVDESGNPNAIAVSGKLTGPEWSQLLWEGPGDEDYYLVGQGDWTAEFIPAATASAIFSGLAQVSDIYYFNFAQSMNTASLVYNGPTANCNLHIETDRSEPAANPYGIGVSIWSETGGTHQSPDLLYVDTIPFGSNSADFPFTVPDTRGIPTTIYVQASMATETSNDPSTTGPALDQIVTATISNE